MGSLSIVGNSTLDITNNKLFIDYGSGPDPITSIAAWIKNGFYDLPGPQITSSDIAADDAASGLSYGIGYADGKDGEVAGLPSGEIEIMFTLLGDANLDGTVNSEDFTPFSANLGKNGAGTRGLQLRRNRQLPKTSRRSRTISTNPPRWRPRRGFWKRQTASAWRMCLSRRARGCW